MKKQHSYYLVGTLLLVVFAGFSYSEFKNALTPYVPYDVARSSEQRVVQVAGGLEKGSSSYEDGFLRFTLVDPETSETIRVRYEGLKPANFEEAISIVAIGNYDAATEEVTSEKLLVKCPSKYQGVEGAETKTYDGGYEETSYEGKSNDTSSYETNSYEAASPEADSQEAPGYE